MPRSRRTPAAFAVSILALLVLGACANPGPAAGPEFDEPQERRTQPDVQQVAARPTPMPYLKIFEIVLATDIDNSGGPANELLAVPANAPIAYLFVRAENLRPGMDFEAEWRRERETIGWSQHRVREDDGSEAWISLPFAPEGSFTSGDYSVRLTVDGRRIESLVFRAGWGRAAQPATATRLVFSASWGVEQQSISTRSSFEFGTQQVVALLLDPPSGGQFHSQWYRKDELIAEVPADTAQSQSVRSFTFAPEGSLPPGQYRVSTFQGSQHVATASFVVTPSPDDATETAILEMAITTEFDSDSGEPGEPRDEVATPAEVFAFVLVENLSEVDVLEARWIRDDNVVAHQRVAGQAISRSWVRFRHEVTADVPASEYQVVIDLNGNPVAERPFVTRPAD